MSKKLGLISFAVISAVIFVKSASAQNAVWRIDSEHSTARLFLASTKNQASSVNVGVARSSGVIIQTKVNSATPTFNFTIYPADHGVNAASAPEYTAIHFKSTRVVPIDEANFRVTGDLTVTHVERLLIFDPTEAYAGAAYGPAVTDSVTQPAVFRFHRMSSYSLTSATEDKAEWSASSATLAEDFPELMNAVSTANWPTFVADERCTMPSTVGEDYAGAKCTGEAVERTARADVHCEMPATVGEDFAGQVCTETSPVRLVANEVQMQLDFHLTRTESATLVSSGQ